MYTRNDIELVGVSEIAKMLDVSKQRVHQLLRSDEFPEPIACIAAPAGVLRVWLKDEIEDWIPMWDRKGGRPKR